MGEPHEVPSGPRRDLLGILVFTPSAFFAMLMVLALSSPEPLAEGRGTAAVARIWAGSIGLLPALFFSAGCAFLGARTFLFASVGLRRGTAGLALVALGASVLLGAFSATAGGVVGDLSSGALARAVHPVAGGLAGAGTLALAVWMAWIRPAGTAKGPPAPSRSSEARLGPVSVPGSELGVTPAEAAALIPENLPSRGGQARKEEPLPASPFPSIRGSPIPVSRVDIRRRGEIPEGARPLPTPNVHSLASTIPARSIDEPAEAPVQHRTATDEPRVPEQSPGEDLAQGAIVGFSAVPFVAAAGTTDETELEEALTTEEFPEEPASETFEEFASAPNEELEPCEPVVDPEPGLSPSWEQPNLFEVGEEPVDAYGTPLSAQEPGADVATEEPEREVVLEPAPPPAKKRKKKPTENALSEHSQLLAEIGCLLVDRGRVAVSMLQKQYAMDFEEATAVLDELQALGLIGPYLGGQRRDILLTREEWVEKISSLG